MSEVDTSVLDDLTRRAVAQKAFLERLGVAHTETKDQIRAALGGPGRKWSITDGVTDLGDVQLTKTKGKAVIDGPRFLAHVIDGHPSELVLQHRLRAGQSWNAVAQALREFDRALYLEFFEPEPAPGCTPAFEAAVVKGQSDCEGCRAAVEWTVPSPALRITVPDVVRTAAVEMLRGQNVIGPGDDQ